MASWERFVRQPQSTWFRKVAFQVHLWTGLIFGVYFVAICVSGSVLVYRNDLYQMFSPQSVFVAASANRMSADQLDEAALRAYPGSTVENRWDRGANQAVEIQLTNGTDSRMRLFNPYTGEDLGDPVPLGFRMTAWLLGFHDHLRFEDTGRRVNGAGAIFAIVLGISGAIVWWPGSRNWRRSLRIEATANWKRLTWSLHSALGFWFIGFLLLWGVTGTYLALPQVFATAFDYIEPIDEANPVERVGDRIQYWLAYLHFGRLGGRGIPWCGRGACDTVTKATWALLGLAAPVMFVTGAVMWWNRVLRKATL